MKNPLLRPWLTEKSTGLTEDRGQYVFQVKLDADKIDIKMAVEEKFGVDVKSVRTLNSLGKTRRQNTRKGLVTGKKNDTKKAIVTLGEGQTIDFYSGANPKGDA
ncbi:50S ribosomal protein L23 [Chlorobium phaeovibrioides]|uniref:Large ribosomal subunit protein uL23 n=2 Tax=Chlorobium phaeovibrioides TaxID=1094 RepID=RL23_CHLPM|nr:50S ribosomal protein L23 [Chlorobium phaeovibrioides]A4SCR1.1 RecName: Full=Large ribosomal subunit protein uL23; AltName: Full=50S ribosomal protein L23 [Chlorobium phaeovibrioides DSM 265]HCD36572.1 50S ribosomal protein L23 [Chlorobium sp.]KAA6231898.1 50S ribosomal protein L23 [Chlorobium phaeovibrioides]MWV53516.1 50S ribosomal protein L23 [Chlorobium phaeovibrioides]QEQ57550.1 50S ribosomal protein L23 [Chlorobium phaeovibrioides]RTY36180.1 50S ribosomal protein L23 [Chlorobium phae